MRIARSELNRRAAGARISGPDRDDLAHQVAADALLAIDRKRATFRGESRFTTWAFSFVVLEVSSKLGQRFWRTSTVSLDEPDWERLPDAFGFEPARQAEWRDLADALRRAVEHDLTPHQREVFVALVVVGVPLDALAERLGSNRNAIYKTMFDARRKLRTALDANGYLDGGRRRP